jgi:hypothetical protein
MTLQKASERLLKIPNDLNVEPASRVGGQIANSEQGRHSGVRTQALPKVGRDFPALGNESDARLGLQAIRLATICLPLRHAVQPSHGLDQRRSFVAIIAHATIYAVPL